MLTENEVAEDRDGRVGESRGGLNVTIVGPGEK